MEPLTQSCWTSFDLKENPSVKDKERKAGGKVKENTQSISKTRSTSSNTSTISSKNPTAFKLVKLSTMERDCWTQLVFKEKPAVKEEEDTHRSSQIPCTSPSTSTTSPNTSTTSALLCTLKPCLGTGYILGSIKRM